MAVRYEPASLAAKPLRGSGSGVSSTTRLFNAELDHEDGRATARPYLAEALPRLNTDSWRVHPDGARAARIGATRSGTPGNRSRCDFWVGSALCCRMRIIECFGTGRPVFSFEFFPPKTDEGVQNLFRTAGQLAALNPSFFSVTYGAGGSTRDLTVDLVARIKREVEVEAMAHLTCVGQSASEIASVLDQLQAQGIANVLPLRGDPPRGETEFVRPEGGFGYAQELIRFIRPRYDFGLAGACYPEGHLECPDKEEDLRHLQEKVAAGVDFLITQLFFDPADYFAFVERARQAGISVPIVPGVMPVGNVSQIERFAAMCGASIPAALHARLEAVRDDEEAVVATGIEWASDQCQTLLAGGAPGIHLYTLNRSVAARAIHENLRQTECGVRSAD